MIGGKVERSVYHRHVRLSLDQAKLLQCRGRQILVGDLDGKIDTSELAHLGDDRRNAIRSLLSPRAAEQADDGRLVGLPLTRRDVVAGRLHVRDQMDVDSQEPAELR